METQIRSLTKAVSYRVVSSLVTGGIVFGVTQRALLALSVAGFETVVKIFVYFLHERAWSVIPYGRTEEKTVLEERC